MNAATDSTDSHAGPSALSWCLLIKPSLTAALRRRYAQLLAPLTANLVPLRRVPMSARRSLKLPIILGVVMILLLVALTVGWVV